MGAKTAISWTQGPDGSPGATWNPIRGTAGRWVCQRASTGCDYCYADAMNVRFGGPAFAAIGADALHDEPRLDLHALMEPLRWQKPRRIFVGSMTDLFGGWVQTDWLDRIFAVMALATRHTFLLLTKRPQLMFQYLADPARPERIARFMSLGTLLGLPARFGPDPHLMVEWLCHGVPLPLPNVWVGTSVENDALAWRAKTLASVPAVCRFISAEPLLGPLPSLRFCMADCPHCRIFEGMPKHFGVNSGAVPPHELAIHWLIAGGESAGPEGRRLVRCCGNCGSGASIADCFVCGGQRWLPIPERLAWVRDLRDRATGYGVAFFFKQWGGPRPHSGGNILDGHTWEEFPTISAARGELVGAAR